MAFENSLKILEGLAYELNWDISDNISELRYLFGQTVTKRRQAINSSLANARNAAKHGEIILMKAHIKSIRALAYQIGVKVDREIEQVKSLILGEVLKVPVPVSQKEVLIVA